MLDSDFVFINDRLRFSFKFTTPFLFVLDKMTNSTRGPFDLQTESTGQNSTWQYKAEQHMTNIYDIKQILSCMIFDGKNVILVI
jgi:hypothetical protein